jgi:hypothetical protein
MASGARGSGAALLKSLAKRPMVNPPLKTASKQERVNGILGQIYLQISAFLALLLAMTEAVLSLDKPLQLRSLWSSRSRRHSPMSRQKQPKLFSVMVQKMPHFESRTFPWLGAMVISLCPVTFASFT